MNPYGIQHPSGDLVFPLNLVCCLGSRNRMKADWKKAAQRFRLWPEETVLLESFFDKDYLEQESYAARCLKTVEELSDLIRRTIDRYGCRVSAAQATEWKAMWKTDGGTEKALCVLLVTILLVEATP